jgi:hypothetical protein
MHQAMIRDVRLALAIVASLCLLAAPVFAGDRPWEQERWCTFDGGLDASAENSASDQRLLQTQFPTDDRHAGEYRRGLSLSLENHFIFSIQSPLAGEWAPGLAFELRF